LVVAFWRFEELAWLFRFGAGFDLVALAAFAELVFGGGLGFPLGTPTFAHVCARSPDTAPIKVPTTGVPTQFDHSAATAPPKVLLAVHPLRWVRPYSYHPYFVSDGTCVTAIAAGWRYTLVANPYS
jgi:hypothetical protein